MAGMELFKNHRHNDTPHATIVVGDAALIIRSDLSYEIVLPSESSDPSALTDAVYAAVGMGLVMEREDVLQRMIENVKRKISG